MLILELADLLGCAQLIIGLESELAETCTPYFESTNKVTLLRALMPLGFQLIHPTTNPLCTGTLIGMEI
jgi:hypothetical protein